MKEFSLNSGPKKNKKIHFRVPLSKVDALREKIKANGLRGTQHFFDALIISGIVMRRPEAIELIRKYKPKYKEIFKQESLHRLKGTPKPEQEDGLFITVFMYKQDFMALNDFVVEENIKRQWVFNILFIDSFLDNEEEGVMKLIERYKSLKISKRKAAIARLANDKYVDTLDKDDAEMILEQMTKEYDEKIFDASLESMIKFSIETKEKARLKNAESEEEELFNAKVRELESRKKTYSVNKIISPIEEED